MNPRKIGRRILALLWYPRIQAGESASETIVDEVLIGLCDVRSADGILVSYDFARDGYVIKQASKFDWRKDDGPHGPDWQEVAFVEAWGQYKRHGGG
jgi:hypothetical protein